MGSSCSPISPLSHPCISPISPLYLDLGQLALAHLVHAQVVAVVRGDLRAWLGLGLGLALGLANPNPNPNQAPWSSEKPGSLFTNGPVGSEPTLFAVTGNIADLTSPKPREPLRHPGYPIHTEARPPETRQEAGKSILELGASRKLQAEGGRYFLIARENETPRHFARLLGVPLEHVLRAMEMSDQLRFKVNPKPNPNPNPNPSLTRTLA